MLSPRLATLVCSIHACSNELTHSTSILRVELAIQHRIPCLAPIYQKAHILLPKLGDTAEVSFRPVKPVSPSYHFTNPCPALPVRTRGPRPWKQKKSQNGAGILPVYQKYIAPIVHYSVENLFAKGLGCGKHIVDVSLRPFLDTRQCMFVQCPQSQCPSIANEPEVNSQETVVWLCSFNALGYMSIHCQ